MFILFFFFNDTATTEIYTLSLHDALPIWTSVARGRSRSSAAAATPRTSTTTFRDSKRDLRSIPASRSCSHTDRKSTRLNSSHSQISYAVFCLKKKTKKKKEKYNIIKT